MIDKKFHQLYPFNYFHSRVADAIEKAWVFICFPTPAYQESDACRKELCLADRKKKKIIPIMTRPDWKPSSWLAYNIGSIPCFKWENVQPDDVVTRMPDLLQRLSNLATGNVSRIRGTMSRNYASEQTSRTNRSPRTPYSAEPIMDRSPPTPYSTQPRTDRSPRMPYSAQPRTNRTRPNY
jgi:hypothetical protein